MEASDLDVVLEILEGSLKPYRDDFPTYDELPEHGRDRADVLQEMRTLAGKERERWHDGHVSGAVYHGDDSHIDYLNEVYALSSQVNPLHADLWPSATKYEAEIVAMTGSMLGGGAPGADDVCGTVTSGGTESILLAMLAYRDRARSELGIDTPHMVAPSTAHAAFDKAARYFDIGLTRVPVGPDQRADVAATEAAITDDTVVVIGSAPNFPHGLIDPIEELSDLARSRGIGFHTDACLGGFVLPWAEKLGADVPPFDFRLPGVTSMSADTHKFGYAAKGTSVVLYRDPDLRRHQYFRTADWSGGLYYSPTFAGSRPGALSAECWAAMVAMGQDGYLEATRGILDAATVIRRGIDGIDDLEVIGDPLWVIAFRSGSLDIYRVMDHMSERGWNLNGLQLPPAVHICVTLRHTQPGVAERFVEDLSASVEQARGEPDTSGAMAPVYGMAERLDTRGTVEELLERYTDILFKV
ncbi:MAG: aminotransferase class V-fold PLP-dependent enzyme [Acidimicrobiia bacterium]